MIAEKTPRPKLLVVDESHHGHHRIYSEHTVTSLARALVNRGQLFYAIPQPITGVPAQHIQIQTPEPTSIRILRRVERATRYPFCTQAKWRWLDQITRQYHIDAMFLLNGDLYLHERGPTPSITCPWVPLVMHPRFMRLDSEPDTSRYLRSDAVPFLYVLDEGVRDLLAQRLSKPVFKFPDLSNDVVTPRIEWAEEIQGRRGNRKIVGVFGAVNSHKNIGGVLKLAAARGDLFFVIAGMPFLHQLPSAERRAVRAALTADNIFWVLRHVPDDELNYLHTLSDILLAPYLRFPHSANRLTKSASFDKPVVVSRGFYMEEVVYAYGLGVSCDPDSVESMSDACSAAIALVQNHNGRAAYLRKNNTAALGHALRPLINFILPECGDSLEPPESFS